MSNDIATKLGQFPINPSGQITYINQLKLLLSQFQTYVDSNTSDIILLPQVSEPTQSEWEMAWLQQTGKTLPISTSAIFYWWDVGINDLGGVYGILLDTTDVVRKDAKYPRSGLVLYETAYKSSAETVNTQIGSDHSVHPSVTITVPVVVRLEMTYTFWADRVTGTGAVAADFLLNGVKVGNQYYGLASDQGLYSIENSGQMRAFADIPNVLPGSYTIQTIFGYVGVDSSPPTFAIGGTASATGNFGIRSLVVKGYTL